MKKMLILTILGSGILFGCGNSEIKNAEVPITPEIEYEYAHVDERSHNVFYPSP